MTILAVVSLATTAAAQGRSPFAVQNEPSVAFRPFFLVTAERFSAHDTFNAIFGRPVQPFFGGGVEVAVDSGLFVDATVSRFARTGQRAFILNGQGFPLGIPLDVSLLSIEGTVGYRFVKMSSNVTPYVGVGVGSYGYKESSSANAASENVDARHLGFLVVGGAEFRLARLLRVSGDVEYTRIPGIIGDGGLSKEAGESDLGGVAGRVRVLVGR